jgi:hypothetical protein
MLTARTILALPLVLLPLVACSSTGTKSSNGTQDASSGKQDAKGDDDAAEKLAKKEFELECAKLELRIKQMGNEAEERSAQHDIEDAERGLRDAREALETFKTHEKAVKLDDGQLDLEQAEQARVQRQQEMEELEAMYKQEELASLTKELVLSRERKALEFAKRRLALQNKTTEHLKSFEMPKKERELTENVAKAERKLADARTKAEKQKLENQLGMLKAQRGIGDLEKEIEKLKKKAGAA